MVGTNAAGLAETQPGRCPGCLASEDPPLSPRSLAQWRLNTLEFASRHRRRILASVIVGLGGFSVAAFGISPLMPDAAELPVGSLSESIHPDGLDEQLAALAAQTLTLNRSTVVRGNDSAASVLQRMGVTDAEASSFMRQDPLARRLYQGRGDRLLQAKLDGDGRLLELVARFPAEKAEQRLTHFTRLTLSRGEGRWQSRIETAQYGSSIRIASGTIRSSLFAATDQAGLPDGVTSQLAEVFSDDIDFRRELRKGDTFAVVYETLSADGEPVPWNDGAGRMLAAQFVNGGQKYEALWYVDAENKGSYHSPEGASRKRSFLASPLVYTRVSSGFEMRFHPLLHVRRAHRGVDYAAPTGTPVRSVAEGLVTFAGRQNGYGNVVEVQHDKKHTTLYAHLSTIDVQKGQRVVQGQTVGGVGATGLATGPHLHFEFRIDGEHQDPLRVAKAVQSTGLTAAERSRFDGQAKLMRDQLAVAASLAGGRGGFE